MREPPRSQGGQIKSTFDLAECSVLALASSVISSPSSSRTFPVLCRSSFPSIYFLCDPDFLRQGQAYFTDSLFFRPGWAYLVFLGARSWDSLASVFTCHGHQPGHNIQNDFAVCFFLKLQHILVLDTAAKVPQ